MCPAPLIPLEIRHGRIVLRDLIPADVEDHVHWHTGDTAWLDWDGPWWRDADEESPERVRNVFEEQIRQGPRGLIRPTLEIALEDGTHVGRVNQYTVADLPGDRAVGIAVRASSWWGHGIGTEAFRLWIAYVLFARSLDVVYTESWSGNERAVRLVARTGFREVRRLVDERLVRGDRYDALRWAITREEFEAVHPGLVGAVSRQVPPPPPPDAATGEA